MAQPVEPHSTKSASSTPLLAAGEDRRLAAGEDRRRTAPARRAAAAGLDGGIEVHEEDPLRAESVRRRPGLSSSENKK